MLGFLHINNDNLYTYNWPGNVRELENVIERIVLLNDVSVLGDNEIAPLLNENKSNQILNIAYQIILINIYTKINPI